LPRTNRVRPRKYWDLLAVLQKPVASLSQKFVFLEHQNSAGWFTKNQ